VTGRHQGLKRKLWAGYSMLLRHPCPMCRNSHILAYRTSFTVTHIIFFIIVCEIACFPCAMRALRHVVDFRTSSSSTRLPLCQILFLSRPPLLS